MAVLIGIYKEDASGTPTAGLADGIALSNGDRSSVESIRLNCLINEISKPQKMAIRCFTGYKTVDKTTLSIVGSSTAMWALAPDMGNTPGSFGAWGDPLVITKSIGEINVLFWIKARALSTELPALDACCSLQVDCNITLT